MQLFNPSAAANGHTLTFEEATKAFYEAVFLPLIEAYPNTTLYEDGILETSVGCFRAATSETTGQVTDVFYTKTRSRLAVDDKTQRFQNTALVIGLWKRAAGLDFQKAKVGKAILNLVDVLPLRTLSGTCGIRFGQGGNFSRSKTMRYRVEKVDGEFEIYVSPFEGVHGKPSDKKPNEGDLVRKWSRLYVYEENQVDGRICKKPAVLDKRTVREAILIDYNNRLARIAQGKLPFDVWEFPMLAPLMIYHRMAASVRNNGRHLMKGEWEKIKDNLGQIAVRGVVSHMTTIIGNFIGGYFLDFNSVKPMFAVEESVQKALLKDLTPANSLIPISDGIIGDLAAPLKAEHTAGWKAVSVGSLARLTNGAISKSPSMDHKFAHWIFANFVTPYNSSIRVHDRHGEVLDLTTLSKDEIKDKVALVRMDTAKGVTLHYVPGENPILYAQYVSLKYAAPDGYIPTEFQSYFLEDKLVRIDLNAFLSEAGGRYKGDYVSYVGRKSLRAADCNFDDTVTVDVPPANTVVNGSSPRPRLSVSLKKPAA